MDIDTGDGWDANGAPAEPAGLPSATLRCDWCKQPFRPRRKDQRFCTKRCNSTWYETCRPRQASVQAGAPRQGSIRSIILGALQDGRWHSAHELAAIAKADSHSVKARISKLKADGHRIETDLPNGNCRRPHRYRLVP